MFISWIKACTSNIYFSLCINGALEGFFISSFGLRQCCPLSPYLFNIVMDNLSSCIENATRNSTFNAFTMGNCALSHLMFADDLLIFGRVTVSNALTLNTIFERFGCVFGLQSTLRRAQFYFLKTLL
ncbi:hypothetical protein KFK09_011236 [Dendrobium nobile]|uniref:Reverse transcriptase domain-containing protein n=1 Tax=Dendrobium nobile TaxID=94219 RepID=A0A8T3BHQ9_DENNO|nr:hypothetical protein KFK09_011236 [Dendrobium nobile]